MSPQWRQWPDEQPARIHTTRLDGTPGYDITEDVLVVVENNLNPGDRLILVASYDFGLQTWWATELSMDPEDSATGREIEHHTVRYWMELPALP